MKRYTKYFTIALITLIAMVNTAVAQSLYSYKPYGTWNSPYSWTTVSGGLQYQNEDLLYPAMNGATDNLVTISENKSMTFNGSEDIYLKSLDVKGTLILEGEHSINVEKLTGKGEIQLKTLNQLKIKDGGVYKAINSFAGTITLNGDVNLDATGNTYNFANIVVRSGKTTLKGNLTVANNLTIKGGSFVFAGFAGNVLNVGGSLKIATGAELTSIGTFENIINVSGDMINDGSICAVDPNIPIDITEAESNAIKASLRTNKNLWTGSEHDLTFLSTEVDWNDYLEGGLTVTFNNANNKKKMDVSIGGYSTSSNKQSNSDQTITIQDAGLKNFKNGNSIVCKGESYTEAIFFTRYVNVKSIDMPNYISKSAYDEAVNAKKQEKYDEAFEQASSSGQFITLQFVGNKDASFRNNGVAKLYRIRGLKEKNRKIEILNTRETEKLKVVAPTLNVKDYKNLPWSVTSGILSLGDGVQIDAWGVPNKGAHNIWNGNMSDYLNFANVGTSMYIPTGATLEIAGAHVNAGVNGDKSSSVYVAGTLDIKAGSLSTSEYSFGVVLVPAQTAGEVGGNAMPMLKVDGGELNASRIVSYNGMSATLNITDGVVNLDVPNGNIDQGNNCHNRNLALSSNSLFSMTGGEMNIKAQFPSGNSKTGVNGILLSDERDSNSPKAISFNVTGGSINIAPGSRTNFYVLGLGVKLYNLNITGGVNVAFKAPQNDWTMSHVESIVSLNDLSIDATSSLDAGSRNLHISGNVTIENGASVTAPTYSNSQDHEVVFTGNANTTYTYMGSAFSWNDVVLEKPGGATMTVASGSQLGIKGNLTANFGKIAGKVSMCGTAVQQITDESESGLSGVELHVANNSQEIQLASDTHLKTVVFEVNKRFYLDGYNLKLEQYPTRTTGSWSENSMFWTNNDDGAGGLTLPVPTSLSNTGAITAHIGSRYSSDKYVYTEVYPMYTVPAGQKKYWTVVSVHGLHPVIQGLGLDGTQYEQYFKFASDVADFEGDAYYCNVKNNYGLFDYRVLTFGINLAVVAIDGDAVNNPSGVNHSGGLLADNYTFTCRNHTSSDFTLSNIGSRSGSSYVSTTSGEWSAKIWKKSDDNSANPTLYNGTEFSTTTNVTIKSGHKITVKGRSNDSKFLKAGKLLIEKGATLEINDKGVTVDNRGNRSEYTIINQLDVRVLDGEGTLQYNITDGNSTGYMKGNPSLFYNNKNATVVYNLSCNYTLNKNGDGAYKWNYRDMPNVVIKSQDGASHTLRMPIEQSKTTTIHGTLTIGSGINAQLYSYYAGKLVVEENVSVAANAKWTIGTNQEAFVVKKNITNKGNIANEGSVKSFTFYGNITNDGTIDLSGVAVSAEGELHSTISGTATAKGKTNLGDLHLNKSMGTIGITTQLPLGDATGLALLKIDCGLFRHSYAGDMITYKGDDCFYIPGGSKFSVDKGTARIYVAEPTADKNDRVKLSGDLEVAKGATLDMLGGIGYTSGSALADKGTINAAFLAPFGGDADIVFSLSSGSSLNLGPTGNYKTYEDFGVWDIREGSNVKITGGGINIKNTASDPANTTIYYHPTVSSFYYAVGITVTTPASKDCRIDAAADLGFLAVEGNSDTRVLIENNALTVSALYVNNGKFYCCGNNLSIYDNKSKSAMTITADGEFSVGDTEGNNQDLNTVSFFGSDIRRISSKKDLTFNNFVFNGSSLEINRDIIVNGELNVVKGSLESSKIIRSRGDVYVNHGAAISGGYLWMEGTENEQALVNEGEIANLVINNPLGVNASSQQANPITITKGLEFQRGSLRIGGNILDMKEGASIEEVGASEFGPDMMIITNASFTDRGVRLYFAAGEERDMVVPLGDGNKYSPFELRNVEALSAGSITVYANKGVHSSIKNSDPSKTNFLKYYWSVKATTGFRIASGSFFMNDDINDAVGLVAPGTCTLNPDDCRYVTTVLNTNTGDFDIAGGTLDFIENGSKLQLTFRNLQAKDISGIYTAGCVKDLPTDGVTTYQTVADGNWSGQAIWQKYNRETSSFEGPAIEVPNKNGSKFIVKHNVTLHPSVNPLNPMDGDSYLNIFSLDIEEGGVVDLNGVENNNFGIVSGTGKLIVRSADMPGANYDSFFNVGGGTIEYSSKDVAITYPVFVGIPYHNNVIFSGKGKRQLPSTNTVSAYGNVAVEGEVEVELNGQDVYLYKNLDFSSTDATCTGDGSFIFRGTETQYLNIPKPMSLAGIGVNNELGVTINDDLTIGKLVLTSGYIKMDADKTLAMNTAQSVVTIGSSSSYIDGWFARPLDATKYTTFPVGNLNRAASTDVYPYTSGVWRVRYSNRRIATEGSVLYNKIMSDLNNSIEGIDNEYWEVDGPGNARVRLRWDEHTNVVDISTLKVITQRDASSWKSISYSKGAVVDNTGVLLTASQTSRVSSAPRIFFFSTSAESASFEWWGYISTSWDEAGNWSKNEVPTLASDITVGPLTDGAYELVIDDDIDGRQANAKSIIIENGGKLTLQGNGTTLYVDKDLTIRTGGQLTLKYDVDANPNFFVKGTISGTTNVERSIKAGRKYYTGSATTERLITPGDGWDESYVYIRKYDHPNYKFVNPGKSGGKYYFDRHADYEGDENSLAESLNTFGILSGTGAKGTVVAGNKYSFYQNGTVSNASKKYTLNAFQGSNWYSNPYPFALKMTKEVLRVTQPTTNDLVEKTIYTYESMNDDGVFEPRSYNLSTGVGVSDFVALAPFQGFEVLCQDRNKVFTRDAVKSQLQLSPVLYTGSAGEEYGIKLKSASLDDTVGKVLRIFAGNDLSTDELVLLFNEEGSMSMISGDSEKKANSAPAVLNQISTDKGGSSLVITHMPSVEELIGMGVTLPINLYKATNANDLSVWIKNIDEFNFTGNIYLVDNLAGVKFNLTLDGEYNCPEVDNLYAGRFELAFEPSEEEIVTPPTAIEVTNSDIERIRIWVESEEKARVTIFGNVEDNARAVVFDIMGREIISQSLTNRVSQIAMPSKGVYVVNVINGKSSKSEKLVL